jgi:hypothetical protein
MKSSWHSPLLGGGSRALGSDIMWNTVNYGTYPKSPQTNQFLSDFSCTSREHLGQVAFAPLDPVHVIDQACPHSDILALSVC